MSGIFVYTFYARYSTIFYYVFASLVVTIIIVLVVKKYLQTNKLLVCKTYGEVCHMDPFDFEDLCAHLISQLGYTDIHVTPDHRDGGVDIWCKQGSKLYGIQCKKYTGTKRVTVEQMRALYGATQPHGAGGIMMTTGYCSKDALAYAKQNSIIVRHYNMFHKTFVPILQQPLSFITWFKQTYFTFL